MYVKICMMNQSLCFVGANNHLLLRGARVPGDEFEMGFRQAGELFAAVQITACSPDVPHIITGNAIMWLEVLSVTQLAPVYART